MVVDRDLPHISARKRCINLDSGLLRCSAEMSWRLLPERVISNRHSLHGGSVSISQILCALNFADRDTKEDL